MRVNPRVLTERTDLLGEIQIPKCPSQFKVIAENIMNMATKLGYSRTNYTKVTELDKMLMVDYWREFDGMGNCITIGNFEKWFVDVATAPELIRRARQWLSEHNYLILDSAVSERAIEAGNKFSKSVSGRR